MPGPIGKRDAERRRRNKDVVETVSVDIDTLITQPVEIPKPPTRLVTEDCDEDCAEDCEVHDGEPVEVESWHPAAVKAYWSLARSGQAIFFEPSDWMTAYTLCEMLSREFKPKPILVSDGEDGTHLEWVVQPVNGAVMNAFLKGWASLMATEGDRRRLKIELERKAARDAAAGGDDVVVSITQDREALFR